ncbi:MAG: DUF3754 domain-containing protein [Planctomycetales bacterium]|nr:DUF3754 domain-containing protein [Planctomycetales bacterium]
MDRTLESAAPKAGQAEPTWQPESRFVPVRAADLARLLTQDAERFGLTSMGLSEVLQAIRTAIEQEACSFHSELEEAYAHFNPDRETVRLKDLEASSDLAAFEDLIRRLSYLLDKANFEQLEEVGIAETIRRASSNRIQVRIRPELVERLDLWVRGHGVTPNKVRTWKHPIKGEEERTPVFKRMAVVARLKDDPHVMIKLFKDIPVAEVEALLPHAEVTMTLLDRVKLFGSTAGVMGTMALKLAKVAIALAYFTQILWILLIGVGTIALRTFFGYRNAKTSRDWRRTQRLYFQNLGNNASALQQLLAAVKQEELKEAYLAYALAHQPGADGLTSSGLRRRVEAYLEEKLGVEVDFDIDDAVETITRLNLWKKDGGQQVRPPHEAAKVLQEYLRQETSRTYHQACLRGAAPVASNGGC